MKLIFLDFDGVLNNLASRAMGIHLVSEKVIMVYELAEATGSNVVISSSWRSLWELRDIKEVLRITGFRDVSLIAGYTPAGHGFTCRGEEIKSVLDANNVESYVIIDDVDDMLPEQQKHFVKTKLDHGLTYKDVSKSKEILSGFKENTNADV